MSHTKERILDAAETLMWEKSFHSVGLNEILKAVGVPKGSFYHYFESKEHFGVELLKHYIAEATRENTLALLTDEIEADPMKRLLLHLEKSITTFQENGGKCPCLVLKLASEVTSLSEAMREVLAKGMPVWMGILCGVFEEAIANGNIATSVDSKVEAALVRDLWAGAIQRSTISQSPEPMKQALTYLRKHFKDLKNSSVS
ncbi:MAG: TetR/AcrR family transcriptional regulator [Akkermansiaceae bacterium]|nr:TetR/AcrR family transcriptional regulator [Akkermansiaceae bacterium]MDP4646212.1 TetR/AcrR family transcriptional regulator [Akkermansiaceae bacterium]MDP4720852.1 TetR/AcrR family transcriptional regulator [Akkermansiaceae bacterium]MDP4780395.1 TetR/AcrR family transcriptional regulator [Akkermansiaceae bacterium]MDP4846694.1 TetR/AcrR family transcriptional regulator [Akkermansiaceae bacterium]